MITANLSVRKRIEAIDTLRGMVMILMALDHVRDFFHIGFNLDQDPLDFTTTTTPLFLTRWITHFCAPIFVFLSGASIFLYGKKGKTKKQVSLFLLTRGIWLILLEVLVITPIWDFNFTFICLQVIFAIGLSMVVFSALIFLPWNVLLFIGLLIIFGHNSLDHIGPGGNDLKSFLWAIIHQPQTFQLTDTLKLQVLYPFLPWLGLMIMGYFLGMMYTSDYDPVKRKNLLRFCGIICLVFFIISRLTNVYGDAHRWGEQQSKVFTFLDFLNVTKYPPSLLYILLTIGTGLIVLSFLERTPPSLARRLVVYGRVPFFYYILHILLIHILAWLAFFFVEGKTWTDLDFINWRNGSLPFGWGYPLWVVYVIWIIVVALLYFPCKWYSRYKASKDKWWLSYV